MNKLTNYETCWPTVQIIMRWQGGYQLSVRDILPINLNISSSKCPLLNIKVQTFKI